MFNSSYCGISKRPNKTKQKGPGSGPFLLRKKMRPSILLTLAITLCGFFSYTISDASAQQEQIVAKIINGTRVTSRSYPIAKVIESSPSGNFLCTGTLITPTIILTAHHCVGQSAKVMSVQMGGFVYKVRRLWVHPNVTTDKSGVIFNDVALLELSRRSYLLPLPLMGSQSPSLGAEVRVIGFGQTETGSYGELRTGMSVVSAVSRDFVTTHFKAATQANSCSGDSGGPALLSVINKGERVDAIVGTVSTGTTANCILGDRTYYVSLRSRSVRRFIQKYAPRARWL